jgi:Ca-activated chloride channel homolog
VQFAQPIVLWLLVLPGALLLLWAWRLSRRRADIRRLRAQRTMPVRERFARLGDLAFWLCGIAASALAIVALAGPQARVSSIRRASVDIVILQDASASMYVSDLRPDRWRRSVVFLRNFAEALSWQGDRVALALFAQQAAPQVRLTKDPNALFFFIDHLGERSPFRLESAPTWDTNIEEGIRWGIRLVEKDREIFGESGNPKAFLVISDGQSWSGTVATALQSAKERGIPVYVVGIGTTVGGMIPEPMAADGTRPPPVVHSVLDRKSLLAIAVAGGGEYFEIGDEPDRVVAFRIIERLRRRAETSEPVETFEALYPRVLMAAAVVLGIATLGLRRPTELMWQAVAAIGTIGLLATLL